MNESYLFDSDVLIDMLNGDEHVMEFIANELVFGRFYTSYMAVGEVYEGTLGSQYMVRSLARFESFMIDAQIDILPITLQTMRIYGQVYDLLRKTGSGIGPADPLIAASALEHGLSIFTRNINHFSRIPGLPVVTLSRV